MAIVGGLLASLALTAPAAHAQFSPGARSLGDRLMPALGNGGYDTLHYTNTFKYDPVANTMLPSSLQAAPRIRPVWQIVMGTPPDVGALLRAPFWTNPIHRLSAEKNG